MVVMAGVEAVMAVVTGAATVEVAAVADGATTK